MLLDINIIINLMTIYIIIDNYIFILFIKFNYFM